MSGSRSQEPKSNSDNGPPNSSRYPSPIVPSGTPLPKAAPRFVDNDLVVCFHAAHEQADLNGGLGIFDGAVSNRSKKAPTDYTQPVLRHSLTFAHSSRAITGPESGMKLVGVVEVLVIDSRSPI